MDGFPASMLTDNGAVFTAPIAPQPLRDGTRGGALAIAYRHSSPYHPPREPIPILGQTP